MARMMRGRGSGRAGAGPIATSARQVESLWLIVNLRAGMIHVADGPGKSPCR